MEDQSLSVYRGHSKKGIGEGPGQRVPHGEQYLAASPALCDQQILEYIRPWMTLSLDPLDYRALGERLESWSCFGAGGYCFVARLTPAGKYDDRPAYFSHGRAWKSGLMPSGFDPGAYLGDSGAFDEPFRDGEPAGHPLSRPPSLIRVEQVAEQRRTAALLLAHLLEAIHTKGCLLFAAPLESFAQGAPLHTLICFARAALPQRLKNQCRIRVYTRRIKLFAQQLGSHLVAVPQDEAEEFCPDQQLRLTILDSSGRLRRGAAPSEQALQYARQVTELACRQPGNLLLFSSRADCCIGDQDTFREDFLRLLPRLYALCNPDPSARQQAILQGLDQNGDSPPPELLQPEDFAGLSAQALCRILQAGLLKPCWGSLQQMACQALSEPSFPQAKQQEVRSLLEASLKDAPAPRPEGKIHLHGLSEIARAGLIPSRQAGAVSFQAPLDALSALTDPSPLLEAEVQSGFFSQRSPNRQQLARLTAHPKAAGALVKAVLSGRLPPGWAPACLAAAPSQAALAFAHHFLAHPNALYEHPPVTGALLERLLKIPQLPASLHPLLSAAMQGLEPIGHLPLYLQFIELRCRSADPDWKAPLLALWARLPEVKDARQRRWLIDKALADEWQSLRPSFLCQKEKGSLTLDPGWLEDVADQIAACTETVSCLSLMWLARLAAHLPCKGAEAQQARLVSTIDSKIQEGPADLPGATLDVQQSGFWRRWTQHSRLPAPFKRQAALAWLQGAWKASAAIEDWDAAIKWLGKQPFNCPEIEQTSRQWGGDRPWAGFFQFQQMQDLARLCSGLDALASLFDLIRLEQRPFAMGQGTGQLLLSASSFADWNLPEDFLDHLVGQGSDSGLVMEEEALARLESLQDEPTQERRGNLFQALRRGAVAQLDSSFPQAVRTARWLRMDSDPRFRLALADSLAAQIGQGKPVQKQDLKFLDAWISPAPPPNRGGRFAEAAQTLLESGFYNLAAFLSPDAHEAGLLHRAAEALSQPAGAEQACWQELLAAPATGRNGGPAHPVSLLAAFLHRRDRPASEASRRQSWDTFCKAVARCPDLIACSPEKGAVLPALQLADLLLKQGSPAQVALEVAQASQATRHSESQEWWEQLFRGLPGPSLDLCLMRLDSLWQDPAEQQRLEATWAALKRAGGPDLAEAASTESDRHEREQST